MARTTESFIEEIKNLFGDRYDYSKVIYTKAIAPVILKCIEHNFEFEQKPVHIIRGNQGCKYCSGRGLSTEDFIIKSKEVFKNNEFDYSKLFYTKMSDKVVLICNVHKSDWKQLPQAHLKGNNPCQDCNGQKPVDREEFIKRSKNLFGNKFDYSFVREEDIKNMHSKVEIHCVHHNKKFFQEINSHLRGANACVQCNKYSSRNGAKLEAMIDAVNKNNSFDYSLTDFTTPYPEKAKIICSVHKITFEQTLNGHFSGRIGCNSCTRVGPSLKETELADFINSLGFEIKRNYRKLIHPKEVDIYIPEKKIAIEFNGLYWHSEKYLPNNYHYDKWERCKENGVQLITVWEDEWDDKQEIVKSHLAHLLGVNNSDKIYARNASIKNIDKDLAMKFFELNHIQGFVNSSMYLALVHDRKTIAVASFTKHEDNYMLSRYATSCIVVGGFSKLINYFEKNYQYKQLITFADNSFSKGDLYANTGWVEDGIVEPDYYYIIGNTRQRKSAYRKSRFEKDPLLAFDESLTEKQLAELNGLERVWDLGKIRFIKPHP